MDFWKAPSKIGKAVDMMVTSYDAKMIMKFLEAHDMQIQILVSNVQE